MGQEPSSDFGQRLAVHRGTFSAGGWLWYIGGILIANGVAQLVKLGEATDTMQALAIASGSAGVGSLLLLVPMMRWRQSVELFERGLIWRRLFGTTSVARADVRKVGVTRHYSRLGSHTEVSVDLANGGQLSIVGVDAAEQLGNMLAAFTAAPAAPAPAVAGYAPGGWRPPTT